MVPWIFYDRSKVKLHLRITSPFPDPSNLLFIEAWVTILWPLKCSINLGVTTDCLTRQPLYLYAIHKFWLFNYCSSVKLQLQSEYFSFLLIFTYIFMPTSYLLIEENFDSILNWVKSLRDRALRQFLKFWYLHEYLLPIEGNLFGISIPSEDDLFAKKSASRIRLPAFRYLFITLMEKTNSILFK